MSFTQELKTLAKASEGMDAGGCWREVIFLHRELGRHENALGRAAWMMRYGQRGEWRGVLPDAAAETLREARPAASVYDDVRLRERRPEHVAPEVRWTVERPRNGQRRRGRGRRRTRRGGVVTRTTRTAGFAVPTEPETRRPPKRFGRPSTHSGG
jgi:hypothetical protein